jgi:hypothetical protein
VLLTRQIIQKQDEIVIINDCLYWKNHIVSGVDHAARYIVTAACVYYPPTKDLLHRNTQAYPIKQIRESLESRGKAWDDYYVIPEQLKIDVLDEKFFDGLYELNNTLKILIEKLNSTNVCKMGESDFARTHFLCTPVEGDKSLFEGLASGALAEKRLQIGTNCKRLASKDQMALETLGMAISTIEKDDPYRNYRGGGSRGGDSSSLADSYT